MQCSVPVWTNLHPWQHFFNGRAILLNLSASLHTTYTPQASKGSITSNLHEENTLPIEAPPEIPNDIHTKMYSFFEDSYWKVPLSRPYYQCAHQNPVGDTRSQLQSTSPYYYITFKKGFQAKHRSIVWLPFPHHLRADYEYTQLVKFRTCLTRVKGSEAMIWLEEIFCTFSNVHNESSAAHLHTFAAFWSWSTKITFDPDWRRTYTIHLHTFHMKGFNKKHHSNIQTQHHDEAQWIQE